MKANFLKFFAIIAFFFSSITFGLAEDTHKVRPLEKTETEELVNRLYEIKDTNIKELNRSEKKELRKEVKEIKKELKERQLGTGIFIGIGIALGILIVALLI